NAAGRAKLDELSEFFTMSSGFARYSRGRFRIRPWVNELGHRVEEYQQLAARGSRLPALSKLFCPALSRTGYAWKYWMPLGSQQFAVLAPDIELAADPRREGVDIESWICLREEVDI